MTKVYAVYYWDWEEHYIVEPVHRKKSDAKKVLDAYSKEWHATGRKKYECFPYTIEEHDLV